MYLILKSGKLKELFSIAIQKAGSTRKLAEKVGISRSAISKYFNEKHLITEIKFKKIEDYIGRSLIKEKDIIKKLPNNWRQILGGKIGVQIKKKNGTFENQLKLARKSSSNKLREWHKRMRENNPEEYHKIQYSRFKKIGNYKTKTKKGEFVRNELEKEVADILKNLGIDYDYEPLVKANGRFFFPDFLINKKIIIECTMWRGKDKAIKLKEKINHLNKKYKIYVVIPTKLAKYYGEIDKYLILGTKEFVVIVKKFTNKRV